MVIQLSLRHIIITYYDLFPQILDVVTSYFKMAFSDYILNSLKIII